MNTGNWAGTALLASVLAVGSLPLYANAKVYTVRDETKSVLKNLADQAYALNDRAQELQSGTTVTDIGRSYFVSNIDAVQDKVDAMGKEIARLEALKSYETPAERRTVRRAKPELAAIAAATTRDINFLNKYPGRLASLEYRQLTASLCNRTEELSAMLRDSVTLSDLARQEKILRKDLAAPDAGQD